MRPITLLVFISPLIFYACAYPHLNHLTDTNPARDTSCYSPSDFSLTHMESDHLMFSVLNKRHNRLVKTTELARMHGKLAHIIIVSDNMDLFGHVHPDDFVAHRHNAIPDDFLHADFDFKRAQKWFVHVDLHVKFPPCGPGSSVPLSLDVALDFPQYNNTPSPEQSVITRSVVKALSMNLTDHLSNVTKLVTPLDLALPVESSYLVRSPELALFSASRGPIINVNQCHSFLFHFSKVLPSAVNQYTEHPLYNELQTYLNAASHVTAIHQSSKQIIHLHGSAVSLQDAAFAKHHVYGASNWHELWRFIHKSDLDASYLKHSEISPFLFNRDWRIKNNVDMCSNHGHHHGGPSTFGPWISVPINLPQRGWWKIVLQTAVKGDSVLVPWFWINAA